MSKFYMESLGIGELEAERIDHFMSKAARAKAVINPRPWANYGKVRVYFDLWSQNKLPAMDELVSVYFDATDNDVIFKGCTFGKAWSCRLSDIFSKCIHKSQFSGAKTRAAISEFIEVFYAE